MYMDDVLIATGEDLDLHRQIAHEVLDLFERESYFLQPAKCDFEQRQITYLGVVIKENNITIDPAKTEGLSEWPRELKTVKEVRSILGILGYQ